MFIRISVSEMAQKSEHASEDHHAAAGKADSAHSHHVKKVKDGSRHTRESIAAPRKHKKKATASQQNVPIKTSIGIRQEMEKPYKFQYGFRN